MFEPVAISLATDFGFRDESVGLIHSILAQVAPGLAVIDLCHEFKPYDVRSAGLSLARSARYMAPGIVVVSVDSHSSRPVVVSVGGDESYLVGPDNGVLAPVVALVGGATRAVELDTGAPAETLSDADGNVSMMKDVYLPAVAKLISDVPLDEVGDLIDIATLAPALLPVAEVTPDETTCSVIAIDPFGNLTLNLDAIPSGQGDTITNTRTGLTMRIEPSRGVKPIDSGALGVVIGSHELVSVYSYRASAAETLGAELWDEMTLAGSSDNRHREQGTVTGVEISRASSVAEFPMSESLSVNKSETAVKS